MWEIVPGRMIVLDFYFFGKKLRLINLYTPSCRNKKKVIFNKLRSFLCIGYSYIICGDFNTVTHPNDRISKVAFKLFADAKVLNAICVWCTANGVRQMLQQLAYKRCLLTFHVFWVDWRGMCI
uniref:Endonuclease/exonuclease/phosphatase domain-containing protein n=1 Tax=Esox lucius TaxID=8010 RepID=A0A6Q2YSP9_ESOLU